MVQYRGRCEEAVSEEQKEEEEEEEEEENDKVGEEDEENNENDEEYEQTNDYSSKLGLAHHPIQPAEEEDDFDLPDIV